jgi:hypothetical protein
LPARIANEFVRLSKPGADVTPSFVSFRDELPFIIDRIMRLARAGCLRNS